MVVAARVRRSNSTRARGGRLTQARHLAGHQPSSRFGRTQLSSLKKRMRTPVLAGRGDPPPRSHRGAALAAGA